MFDVCLHSPFWPQANIPLSIATPPLRGFWTEVGPPVAQGSHNRACERVTVWFTIALLHGRMDLMDSILTQIFLVYSWPGCWVTVSHHTAALLGCLWRVIRHNSTPSLYYIHIQPCGVGTCDMGCLSMGIKILSPIMQAWGCWLGWLISIAWWDSQ